MDYFDILWALPKRTSVNVEIADSESLWNAHDRFFDSVWVCIISIILSSNLNRGRHVRRTQVLLNGTSCISYYHLTAQTYRVRALSYHSTATYGRACTVWHSITCSSSPSFTSVICSTTFIIPTFHHLYMLNYIHYPHLSPSLYAQLHSLSPAFTSVICSTTFIIPTFHHLYMLNYIHYPHLSPALYAQLHSLSPAFTIFICSTRSTFIIPTFHQLHMLNYIHYPHLSPTSFSQLHSLSSPFTNFFFSTIIHYPQLSPTSFAQLVKVISNWT